jgi:protease II
MTAKTVKPFAGIRSVAPATRGETAEGLEEVQEFLQRFGYLEKGSYRPNELDDPTSEALRKYQRANGRRPTGEFNKATRDQMSTHRCGLPDMASGIEFVTLCSWNKTDLTFAFDTGTDDIGGAGEFQAVRNAFQTWAKAVSLTFTEVALNQYPDIRIGWRPANDPDHSMVGGVLAHADFPPGCSVVTNTLPKPVHFDDQEHAWRIGAVANAFDVETVALHEIGHILGLAHSSVAGSVMFASVSSNFTKRVLTADDISGVQALYSKYPSIPLTLQPGTYTLQQKSNNRFADAHENAANDFALVTRPAQNNDTQRWIFRPVGGVYTVQQKINNRFADAHENAEKDFALVTRPAQNNDTQRWILMHQGNDVYTIQQLSNGRFVDAYEEAGKDFAVVTRPAQNNDTQRWTLASLGNNTFTIRQKSSGRFLDAHEIAGKDFALVTRPAQNNDSQRWTLTPVGVIYTIQQKSNGRYVDAHEDAGKDFALVTRPIQNNNSQRWLLKPLGGDAFTIQQMSNNRFVDAHEIAGKDFALVTRTAQNNDTQRWLIKAV